MNDTTQKYSLLWICNSDVTRILDAATWLSVTQEMRNMGWNVTLLTIGKGGEHTVNGVNVFGISAPRIYLIGKIIYILKLFFYVLKNSKKYDFVLFHHFDSPAMIIPRLVDIIFKGKNRPLYVLDSRSLSMSSVKSIRLKDRLRYLYNDSFDKWGHKLFDGRTAITKRIVEVIGIPREKLWGIWPSGVVVDDFSTVCEKRKFPHGDEIVELIYIGTLDEIRNLMNLSKAIIKANDAGMNFGLILIGEGDDKINLLKIAKTSNGKVRVYDHVDHSEIPDWLARSHVGSLVFPDRVIFQVSSPIKLFEYMASGLPIFATRIACHTDVIGNGEYVFWAENSDVDGLYAGLVNVWNHRNELSQMGIKSKEASANWTWKSAAQKLMNSLVYGKEEHLRKYSTKFR